MDQVTDILSQTSRRILLCLHRYGPKSKEDLEILYDRMYPPPRTPRSVDDLMRIFRRFFSDSHISIDFEEDLIFLCKGKYCSTDVIYFTDRVVKEGVRRYFITEKGKERISRKK